MGGRFRLVTALLLWTLVASSSAGWVQAAPARQAEPDRALVAYVQAGDVMVADEFGEDVRQLTDDGFDWFNADLEAERVGTEYTALRWSPSGRYLLLLGNTSDGALASIWDAVSDEFSDIPGGLRSVGWAVDEDLLLTFRIEGQDAVVQTVSLDGDVGPDMTVRDIAICGGLDGPQVDPAFDVLRHESHSLTNNAQPLQFSAQSGALLFRLDGCAAYQALSVDSGLQTDYDTMNPVLGPNGSVLEKVGDSAGTLYRSDRPELGASDRVQPLGSGRVPAWSTDQMSVFATTTLPREELVAAPDVPGAFVRANEVTLFSVPATGGDHREFATLDAFAVGSMQTVPGDAAIVAAVVGNAYEYADALSADPDLDASQYRVLQPEVDVVRIDTENGETSVLAEDAHYPAVQPESPSTGTEIDVDETPASETPESEAPAFETPAASEAPADDADPVDGGAITDPDGLLAYAAADGNIVVARSDGSERWAVTTDGDPDRPYHDPVWSPDGRSLLATHTTEVDGDGLVTGYDIVIMSGGARTVLVGGGSCASQGFMPDSQHLAWHCGGYGDDEIEVESVDLSRPDMGYLTQTALDGTEPEVVLAYSREGTPRWGTLLAHGRLSTSSVYVSPDGAWVLADETGIGLNVNRYDIPDGEVTTIATGFGIPTPDGESIVVAECSGACGLLSYDPVYTVKRFDPRGVEVETFDRFPQGDVVSFSGWSADGTTLYFYTGRYPEARRALFALDTVSGETEELTGSTLGDLLGCDDGECASFTYQPSDGPFVLPDGSVAADDDAVDDGAEPSAPDEPAPIVPMQPTATEAVAADSGTGEVEPVETPVYRSGDGGGDPFLVPYAAWIFYAGKSGGQWDIYAQNPRTGEAVRLTDTPFDEWAPAGNRDGNTLYYLSDVTGTTQLYSVSATTPGDTAYQHTSYDGPGEITYFTLGRFHMSVILTVSDDATSSSWLMQQRLYAAADPDLEYFSDVASASGVGINTDGPGPWRSLPQFTPANSVISVNYTGSETDIVIERADGTTSYIAGSTANEDNPALSRDGTRLAYNVDDASGQRHIVVQDLVSGAIVEFPRLGDDSDPVWSPDGTQLAFVSNDGVSETIWVVPADGSAPAEPLGIPDYEQVWYLDWPA